MKINEKNSFCLCSPEILNKYKGQLFNMILNEDGTYYNECRICHKIINIEYWRYFYDN